MAHIDYLELCSAREIANLAFVDPAEVSRALRTLKEHGLVRLVDNPKNRKSSLVSLTPKGQELHGKIRSERGKIFDYWVSDLSEDERKQLDSTLRSIIRRVVMSAPQIIVS